MKGQERFRFTDPLLALSQTPDRSSGNGCGVAARFACRVPLDRGDGPAGLRGRQEDDLTRRGDRFRLQLDPIVRPGPIRSCPDAIRIVLGIFAPP